MDSSHCYNDRRSRCSIPLLKQGGVFLQICALFTETNDQSVFLLNKQVGIFESLIANESLFIKEGFTQNKSQLHLLLSIENASGLCLENEPFDFFEKRLSYLLKRHRLCYIGLVWNHNNRFCGSIASSDNKGLSDEGKEVLRILSHYSLPIDLSHSSDKTIEDIFNFLDNNNLSVIPIASHSNFRDICMERRNLIKEHSQEIVRRGGIIGLNFYQKFVGNSFKEDFLKHIFYAKEIMGCLDSICFGSDFFYSLTHTYFDNTFGSSECFPLLAEFLSKYLTKAELNSLFYKNLEKFLLRNIIL